MGWRWSALMSTLAFVLARLRGSACAKAAAISQYACFAARPREPGAHARHRTRWTPPCDSTVRVDLPQSHRGALADGRQRPALVPPFFLDHRGTAPVPASRYLRGLNPGLGFHPGRSDGRQPALTE